MPRTFDDKPLSPHFMLSEFTVSSAAVRAGLPNEHLALHERNMARVAVVLERVRTLLGDAPIVIRSGYGSPAVNKLVGGSKTSAHMSGRAVDFTAPRYGDPIFAAEAHALFNWRSQVFAALRTREAAVTAGTQPVPSAEALIASLPQPPARPAPAA